MLYLKATAVGIVTGVLAPVAGVIVMSRKRKLRGQMPTDTTDAVRFLLWRQLRRGCWGHQS